MMGSPLSFKFLIIGDKEVGRSTLLKKRFKTHYLTDSGLDIVGACFYTTTLILEGRDIRLTIWYISNNERFRPIWPNFITGAHGVILMFDLTRIRTLHFLSKFLQLIREKQGEIPILLLGNKVDLEEAREVSRSEAISFARENNLLDYKEISAKTGQNCENIFKIVAGNILTQK